MYFKADGPSDVLSFLSIGTPDANLPPMPPGGPLGAPPSAGCWNFVPSLVAKSAM